jgi:hypothetical protein
MFEIAWYLSQNPLDLYPARKALGERLAQRVSHVRDRYRRGDATLASEKQDGFGDVPRPADLP